MAVWLEPGNIYTRPYHVVLCRKTALANTAAILNNGAATTALPAFPAAEALEILSSSDEDGGAGTDTGMLTAAIVYLDGTTGTIATLNVTLNGTTVVALSDTSITRVLGIHGLTFGSANAAVGTVTVRVASAGANRMSVDAGFRSAFPGRYTIPEGYIGFYRGFDMEHTTSSTPPVKVDYWIRADISATTGLQSDNAYIEIDVGCSGPATGKSGAGRPGDFNGQNRPLPAGTTIEALAVTDVAGAAVTVSGRIFIELVTV